MILVIGCNRVSQVTYVKGYGRFTDANTIEVQGINGQTTVWKTKNTIIATGSEPVELPFMKFNDDGDKTCVSSTGALVLPKVSLHGLQRNVTVLFKLVNLVYRHSLSCPHWPHGLVPPSPAESLSPG